MAGLAPVSVTAIMARASAADVRNAEQPAEALARQLFRLSDKVSRGDVNGALGSLRDLLPRARGLSGADDNPEDTFFAKHTNPLTALRVMVKLCERQIAEIDALATPLDTLTVGELWEQPEPEVSWLVDGLLPQDGLSLIVAPPKAGKSTLVRCLAAVVSTGGGEWLGRTTTGGTVLHLALEERSQTVKEHYRWLLKADPSRLHIRFGPPPLIEVRWGMLRQTIRNLKPALVIVDTLARWSPTEDGNAYSQVNPAMDPFIEIAREFCHVVLVHHSRKSGGEHGEEALGSTSFGASVDTILSIKRKGSERTITSTGRDGADMEESVLVMDDRGMVTLGGTKAKVECDRMSDRVLRHLNEAGEEQTTQEIIEALGVRRENVCGALRQLTQEQRIVRTGSGKGQGNAYQYSVPSSQSL